MSEGNPRATDFFSLTPPRAGPSGAAALSPARLCLSLCHEALYLADFPPLSEDIGSSPFHTPPGVGPRAAPKPPSRHSRGKSLGRCECPLQVVWAVVVLSLPSCSWSGCCFLRVCSKPRSLPLLQPALLPSQERMEKILPSPSCFPACRGRFVAWAGI